VSTDGNSRYAYLDPRTGGRIAVAEAARNVAVTGAEPIGVTDCLNFGNPMDPEIFWQFKQAVMGMAETCRALNLPVTGGNVSFYNESPSGAVDPAPVVGVVGLLEHADLMVTPWFKSEGDLVVVLGTTYDELGGSSWLYECQGVKAGKPPKLDLKREAALQKVLVAAARKRWLRSAQDCADGGLSVALAECTFLGRPMDHPAWGATVNLSETLTYTSLLFSESQSRAVVTVAPQDWPKFKALCQAHRVPCRHAGRVEGGRLRVYNYRGEKILEEKVPDLYRAWEGGLKPYVQGNV